MEKKYKAALNCMVMDKGMIVKMLAKKAGYDVATPHGSERVQKDIELQTGERLSVNTVKRLTGVLPYDGLLRTSTLDIIARYLGYRGTGELLADLEGKASDFSLPEHFVDLSELQPETRVVLEWSPNRRIVMRHIEGGRYLLEQSCNSKLQAGDIIAAGMVAEGMPFIVRDVMRGDASMGPYTAAPENGLTKVDIVE